MPTDPVCGMKLDAARTDNTFLYNSRQYYFCSVSCKQYFEKNPVKYAERLGVKAAEPIGEPKKEGFFKRHLAK